MLIAKWPQGSHIGFLGFRNNFSLALNINSKRYMGKTLLIFLPPPNEVGGGVYWIHLVRPSVRPTVRPSVCRRHGFRRISQVSLGISISNFICMLMVAIGESLLIFSDAIFKMAAWRPYWIFWFPDSNFTLALNINFKLQRTIHMHMGRSLLVFSNVILKMAAWRPY